MASHDAKRIGATPRARAEEKDLRIAATQSSAASFRTQGGRRRWAKVECAEGVFLVPYGLLECEDGPS